MSMFWSMGTWRTLRATAVAGCLLALPFTAYPQSTNSTAAQASDYKLLDHVSKTTNAPISALDILDRSTVVHSVTGVQLEVVKMQDRTTGQMYVAAIDQHGNVVDPGAAAANEKKARQEKFGKIDPKLANKLNAAGTKANAAVPVSVWVAVPEPNIARPEASTEAELTAAMNAYYRAVEQYVAAANSAVLAEMKGMNPNAKAARFSPAVFAELTAAQIKKLEKHPAVAAIYTDEENKLQIDDANTTIRAHRVWAGGNIGAGRRVAVHEPDGVADFNPYLNNPTKFDIFFCADTNGLCSIGKNVDDHASVVAGVITGTHPLYRGTASGAGVVLSANSQGFGNQQLVDAFEWAVGNSADVVNLSWGSICSDGNQNFNSRYADWATRVLAITQTISSGNTSGCSDDLRVSMPGGAYNVITVGAISDNNTGFWSDDSMAGFSRYLNPNNGAEKPEVVAVGVDVAAADAQGGDNIGFGWNGTSFSAPHVAGVVALMLARQPTQRTWPETNKAAIMASAMHDIVAGTSQDGVGAVVATVADDTYKNARFKNTSISVGSMNQSCGPIGGAAICQNFLNAFTATAGTRVRVAIAWDAIADPVAGTSELGADIDLYIVRPDNVTIQAISASGANPWELVDFVAPVTGAYDIYLRRFASSATWPGTFLGAAWAFGNATTLPNMCAGELPVAVSAAFVGNIVKAVNTVNGSTFFDSITGWPFAQTGREQFIKLTLAAARDVQISDTNSSLDMHLMRLTGAGCAADPPSYTPILSTINGPAKANNLAAGTYYIIVDGFNGAVGTTNVTINISGPTIAGPVVSVPPIPTVR